eukprot:PITA_34095
MWVKGSLLQFIVDSGSQKNLILVEVMKRLGLPTRAHPQSYTIGCLHQGWDLRVSQQCRLPYNIKPFTDDILCDVDPLDDCYVLLGQPYLQNKLISKTGKFVFLMIHPQGNKETVAITSRRSPFAWQEQTDKVMEDYEDIFTSPIGVPLHCQVKHSVDSAPGVPLPNGPIYWCSILENDEIKR